MQQALSLVHRIKEPTQTSGGPPPLMLLLHGLGGNEGSLYFLADKLDGRFFFVSARAPYDSGGGGYAWFHARISPGGSTIEPEEAEKSRRALLGFIDELTQAFPVDPSRVYLMGFSQGTIMSLSAVLTCPEKIAGVVAASGRILPEVLPLMAAPDRLAAFPVFVSHGIRDEILPIRHGRDIRDRLSLLGMDLSYHEYPMGHEIRQECVADISDWLRTRLDGRKADQREGDPIQ
jgi:phospholipase/carboxylesterase